MNVRCAKECIHDVYDVFISYFMFSGAKYRRGVYRCIEKSVVRVSLAASQAVTDPLASTYVCHTRRQKLYK